MLMTKVPQQFMVNFMYLLVTAMLAIPVSGLVSQELESIQSELDNSCSHQTNSNNHFTKLAGLPNPGNAEFMLLDLPKKNSVMQVVDYNGGKIRQAEFIAHNGLIALLKDFDFDAKCDIVSYRMTRVGFREDPIENLNKGAGFTAKSRKLVNKAKKGDIFYFDDIKAKCPKDEEARELPGLAFRII